MLQKQKTQEESNWPSEARAKRARSSSAYDHLGGKGLLAGHQIRPTRHCAYERGRLSAAISTPNFAQKGDFYLGKGRPQNCTVGRMIAGIVAEPKGGGQRGGCGSPKRGGEATPRLMGNLEGPFPKTGRSVARTRKKNEQKVKES